MKLVYPIRQVAHLWANQTQASARNPQGNFYFDDGVIYSYGRHFPIAAHATITHGESKGRAVVLFSNESNSVTTMGHKNNVRQALHGLDKPIFTVKNVLADNHGDKATAKRLHTENFNDYKTRVIHKLQRASKARQHKASYINEAIALIREGNAYAQAFGLRLKPMDESKLSDMEAEASKAQAIADKERSKFEANMKLREEIKRIEFESAIAEWKKGERDHLPYTGHSVPVEFRLVRNGAVLQTSRGAEVPTKAARVLFKAIAHALETTTTERLAGVEIGAFKVARVESNGDFIAGCHTILWSKVKELAKEQGWM